MPDPFTTIYFHLGISQAAALSEEGLVPNPLSTVSYLQGNLLSLLLFVHLTSSSLTSKPESAPPWILPHIFITKSQAFLLFQKHNPIYNHSCFCLCVTSALKCCGWPINNCWINQLKKYIKQKLVKLQCCFWKLQLAKGQILTTSTEYTIGKEDIAS